MKNLLFLFITLFLFSSSSLFGQQSLSEIKMKVADKSGLFGMAGPRFAKLALSTRNKEKVLNCDNVNAGPFYYFLFQNDGTNWKVDPDFIKDELPKLSITQETIRVHPELYGEITTDGDTATVLIGFPKGFAFHKPFALEFPLTETVAKVELIVPQELWPGYTKVTKYFDASTKALNDLLYKGAIFGFTTLLADTSLAIFPSYAVAKEKRLEAFEKYYADVMGTLSSTLSGNTDMKLKIAASSESIGKFQFLVDSLADQSAGILPSDPTIAPLQERSKASVQRSQALVDSLRLALDDLNVRWIIAGSSAGKIDFKYKYIVEALAYAFTSVNFSDSTMKELTLTLPEELSARLKKYNLMDSYETFVRIAGDRWKKHLSLFPPDFLTNLDRDSVQFPLPYHSVLKAVNDFYSANYPETKKEILLVMKKSYDHELTGRMDYLRVLIDTREKKIPREVLQNMTDGKDAEEKGNSDGAAEHYKDAMLIAEDYAPAAFALGKLYDRIGDSYKANNFFQKAISTDTLYYSAYRFLYINYFKNSNFKPMTDLLTQALSRGNDFYDIHYYLGIAYNGAALYEDAIKQYERALELNGKSVDANIQAGIAYQNMKSYAKAREYYARAIQIDPENQTATENLKRLDDLQKKF